MRVLGIDEAGRGCVLGDLFVGAFWCDDPDDTLLLAAGAADSKALTHPKRVAAAEKLVALGTSALRRVEPTRIDEGNLNELEHDAIVDLILEARPDAVIIDALGPPAALPGLIRRLSARIPADRRPTFTIEPKADAKYPVVGAASIFAKVARDAALDALKPEWGELGSGYPSDPKTKAWLSSRAATRQPWPAFVRTRWSTITAFAQTSLL